MRTTRDEPHEGWKQSTSQHPCQWRTPPRYLVTRAPWVTHFGFTRTPFSKTIPASQLWLKRLALAGPRGLLTPTSMSQHASFDRRTLIRLSWRDVPLIGRGVVGSVNWPRHRTSRHALGVVLELSLCERLVGLTIVASVGTRSAEAMRTVASDPPFDCWSAGTQLASVSP
jgi:hypothetical protein